MFARAMAAGNVPRATAALAASSGFAARALRSPCGACPCRGLTAGEQRRALLASPLAATAAGSSERPEQHVACR